MDYVLMARYVIDLERDNKYYTSADFQTPEYRTASSGGDCDPGG